MPVTRLHSLCAVVVNATTLGGITAHSVNLGANVRAEARSGEVYPRFQSLLGERPGAAFATNAIAAALDLCGATGYDLDAAAGLTLYAQAFADGATRAGAASHRKYVIADGLLVPGTIDCAHMGDATISYAALATSADGVTHPVAITEAQSIPADITDAERFTLGGVTLESVSLPEVRNISIAFGINARTEGADSQLYDTFAYIVTITPVITLRGIDVEWLKSTNIPLTGKAVTHANTSIYLRKRAAGSTFVADATPEHIKFTAAGLAWVDGAFDGSGDDPAEVTLTLQCAYDGANAPIVINTAAAIT